MKSKTSFFNKTVFKKNLTRFAPVMAVYTLCLILGMMMLYQINEEMGRTFWFASRIAGNLQLMGLVNLLFAPLVACCCSATCTIPGCATLCTPCPCAGRRCF